MNIKHVQEKKNKMMFPIYCVSLSQIFYQMILFTKFCVTYKQVGAFRNFAIIGGGGGTNELPNFLKVYDLNNPGDVGSNHLQKEVDSYAMETSDVPNYIDVANVSNICTN